MKKKICHTFLFERMKNFIQKAQSNSCEKENFAEKNHSVFNFIEKRLTKNKGNFTCLTVTIFYFRY